MGFKGVYITRTCFPDEQAGRQLKMIYGIFQFLKYAKVFTDDYKIHVDVSGAANECITVSFGLAENR